MYSDDDVAALYDLLNTWGADDDFFLSAIAGAERVLDVGCGTGRVLIRAKEAGHPGRLVGLDPDRAALARARRCEGVDWVEGRATDATGEFDVAIMTGNAFQCLTTDADLRDALTAIRRVLVPGGVFAFSTRHPQARAWEDWPRRATRVTDHRGVPVVVTHAVDPRGDGVVGLTETTAARTGEVLRVDHCDLRFLEPERIEEHLVAAGFTATLHGDWQRGPLTAASTDVVAVAVTAS
ncbi:class I SAM-dependent methyltransferase [Actinokineospora bangkokensis]|uniref:Methyltransferase n=1 Tax=Actinokineospora bangkokensis TaxID=1193682 RepID=A0A1Q9LLH9_9PSEU|nr:class I SAM-dependent methyltransferase [Actinokineospora bangkokensis]OLR92853.1 methyltransferase [Actinokineospora bangkokensis]